APRRLSRSSSVWSHAAGPARSTAPWPTMPGSSTSSPAIPSRRVTSSSVTTPRAGGTSSLRRSTIRRSWSIESSGRSAPASRARRPTVRRVDAERRARAPLPRASARTLGTLLLLGVRAPHLLRPDTVGAVAGLLRTPGLGAAVYNRCLRVLGAIIYGRPVLADASVVDSVKALYDMAGIPHSSPRRRGVEVLHRNAGGATRGGSAGGAP